MQADKSTKNTIVTDASKSKKPKIPPKTVKVKRKPPTPETVKNYVDYLRKLDRSSR